uniref:Zgc:113425 n=1 Tax=Poecilia reticulata TaxID=8081 RepID=A0A3P9MUZ8_POERE
MDRYRYFIFNQKSVLILGILQIACTGVCVVCGLMDAAFRKNTPLSTSRTPLWGGLVMACPGVLALFASQRKNAVLVSCMVVAVGLSCAAAVVIFGYSCLTLTYGEEDEDVFHQHKSAKVTFVLHRMVKGANATIILTCIISLVLSSLIGYVGFRSLPCCGCYDSRTGLVRIGSPPPLCVRLKELIISWYNVSPKVMLLCLSKLLIGFSSPNNQCLNLINTRKCIDLK